MIDPTHSLAFSIQANRGVYAVLLGSGVSRSAGIPTGWEITLDLARKLSELDGESGNSDTESWYRSKFGKEPDYSELLDQLAKTRSERQQLLRKYFEPNDQEREERLKQPTAAHHAIAALAAHGFVRVVLTTNFDRLVEQALEAAGIVPTVINSDDSAHGALPLIHTPCCVIKLHGDYGDIRIRNTEAELEEYPPELDALLDRIFDEFGLIVCGWSAEWDTALRSAMKRANSRRFTTYWAVRGEPGERAQELIRHRRAVEIPISDADSFFSTVQQNIESIEEFSKPHPLSTEAAVASLKRFMSESRYRIQLSDLVDGIVERVVESTGTDQFAVRDGPTPDAGSITGRVRRYEAVCSTLLAMATVGGFWAEEEHFPVWQEALRRLGSKSQSSGNSFWIELQRYPGTLLLYALGLGAVKGNRLRFLGSLLSTVVERKDREDLTTATTLPPCVLIPDRRAMRALEGMERHYLPLNEWLLGALRPHAKRILPDNEEYTRIFDKLEILIALGADQTPFGMFMFRYVNREAVLREIRESLSGMKDRSPFVGSGIFGDSAEDCEWNIVALEETVSKATWY